MRNVSRINCILNINSNETIFSRQMKQTLIRVNNFIKLLNKWDTQNKLVAIYGSVAAAATSASPGKFVTRPWWSFWRNAGRSSLKALIAFSAILRIGLYSGRKRIDSSFWIFGGLLRTRRCARALTKTKVAPPAVKGERSSAKWMKASLVTLLCRVVWWINPWDGKIQFSPLCPLTTLNSSFTSSGSLSCPRSVELHARIIIHQWIQTLVHAHRDSKTSRQNQSCHRFFVWSQFRSCRQSSSNSSTLNCH